MGARARATGSGSGTKGRVVVAAQPKAKRSLNTLSLSLRARCRTEPSDERRAHQEPLLTRQPLIASGARARASLRAQPKPLSPSAVRRSVPPLALTPLPSLKPKTKTTVEDLLLWHDIPKSAAALGGATLLYLLLEWSGIPLMTWLSNVGLALALGCAIWALAAGATKL